MRFLKSREKCGDFQVCCTKVLTKRGGSSKKEGLPDFRDIMSTNSGKLGN